MSSMVSTEYQVFSIADKRCNIRLPERRKLVHVTRASSTSLGAQASQIAQFSMVSTSVRLCPVFPLGSSAFYTGSRIRVAHWEPDGELPQCTGRSGSRLHVVSMARERRIKMVSQQIKREISEMLLHDKVLQEAVLPESALGADMYLTAVATISEVEMSKDLSVAKVYISVYGDERGQDIALAGLKNKAGYVRKGIAQRMNLKFTPEIRFIKDEALERGSRVISILETLKQEREAKERRLSSNAESTIEEEEEEDLEEGELEDDEESPGAKSLSSVDGHETDWVEEDENITFIK